MSHRLVPIDRDGSELATVEQLPAPRPASTEDDIWAVAAAVQDVPTPRWRRVLARFDIGLAAERHPALRVLAHLAVLVWVFVVAAFLFWCGFVAADLLGFTGRDVAPALTDTPGGWSV